MLDCTDRHFRYLMRLITKKALLYTEMLTIKDILEDPTSKRLKLNPLEPPVALQLGGSHPELLARCVSIASAANYDEINLNVGCPSHKVQNGGIGACLMLQPKLVARCVATMQAATQVPITVKCRLGVDHQDSYQDLAAFIREVAKVGCEKFIIHARKAWLKGLSPKQNREIPPLNYDWVYRLKLDFPDKRFILNGGITSIETAQTHLDKVDGVMIGRAVYNHPFLLAGLDKWYFGEKTQITEQEVVRQYLNYVENELAEGTRLTHLIKPLLGLFYKQPRASYWRKHLSCNSTKQNAGIEVIYEALAKISANSHTS